MVWITFEKCYDYLVEIGMIDLYCRRFIHPNLPTALSIEDLTKMYKGEKSELYRQFVHFIFTDPIYVENSQLFTAIFEDLANFRRRTLRVLVKKLEKENDPALVKQMISTLLEDMILFTDKEQIVTTRTVIEVKGSERRRAHRRVKKDDEVIILNYEELINLEKKIVIPRSFRNHVFIHLNIIDKFGSFQSNFNSETYLADIISYDILDEEEIKKLEKIVYSISNERTREDTMQNLVTIRKIMEKEIVALLKRYETKMNSDLYTTLKQLAKLDPGSNFKSTHFNLMNHSGQIIRIYGNLGAHNGEIVYTEVETYLSLISLGIFLFNESLALGDNN